MNPEIKNHYDELYSTDKEVRYSAFQSLITASNEPVEWAYEIWDDVVKLSEDKDNHMRTIAVQLISNLAKNDKDKKLINDFPVLYKVTFDDKFVTARHSLQCLWKIAVVNEEYSELVLSTLTKRFREAAKEKNATLLRYDILEVFKMIFAITKDQKVRQLALELIVTEADPKYKKKYTGLWKNK